jgi:hypothetical protein
LVPSGIFVTNRAQSTLLETKIVDDLFQRVLTIDKLNVKPVVWRKPAQGKHPELIDVVVSIYSQPLNVII